MSAAYAMATNVNRAFKEYGWCTRIRGVESGGEVINLPTHTFATDDGGVDLKCPTEIAITDRREAELAKSGLIPLDPSQEHRQGRLHRRPVALSAEEDEHRRGHRVGESLVAPALHVRRVALRALSEVHGARQGRLDQGDGPSSQAWLQDWITRYIDGDPKGSSERTKAEKPLADARVEVIENEENPGYYSARFFLRPHYQLEGMDIGMSLVSRLPAKAS